MYEYSLARQGCFVPTHVPTDYGYSSEYRSPTAVSSLFALAVAVAVARPALACSSAARAQRCAKLELAATQTALTCT